MIYGTADDDTVTQCRQCGIGLTDENRTTREIVDTVRASRGRAALRRTSRVFCSTRCGAHYQMGCEG